MPRFPEKFNRWRSNIAAYLAARLQRHEFGFTADMDNTGFPASSLKHFRRIWRETLVWLPPTEAQKQRFRSHPLVSKSADALIAVSGAKRREYWVLENFTSGFPDPAEFLFVGFEPGQKIFAAGRFEDWPENWQRITG